MNITYYTHPACLEHDTGPGHPESALRLKAIRAELEKSGVLAQLDQREAPAVTTEQLLRVHTPQHLHRLQQLLPQSGSGAVDPDTLLSPASLRAAERAAGAVVAAVDRVLEPNSGSDIAFCAVRPPGHHAEPERAMGFCLYNNIAVGAAHALHWHNLQRVVIFDFDVHYGNGTEAIFRHDPRVVIANIFQQDHWPYLPCGSGRGDASSCLAFSAGSGGKKVRQSVATQWRQIIERSQPQLILVSAGFDAHSQDPLAELQLEDEDYHWLGSL
ncbi:MAG: histone deacetylase family protein, partial [Gammaproteobacteria bacterium]|nr:histone deacetylase family protein [Gammaproteobacteria bacterium]